MKKCKSSKCQKAFEPKVNWQQYCCNYCRNSDFKIKPIREADNTLVISLCVNIASLITLIFSFILNS